MQNFLNNYNRLAGLVDPWIEEALARLGGGNRLREAAAYCLFPGAKRLRPLISLAMAEVLAVPQCSMRSLAVSLEFIHTSSLIHDDLPALDNDDFRRGKPSCHKQFGEDLAVLAGDLLLSEASRVIAEADELSESVRIKWLSRIGQAIAALCEGQVMDLHEAAGQGRGTVLTQSLAKRRDLLKTAALFQTALVCPLDLLTLDAKEYSEKEASLKSIGSSLGLLFQLTDDLLDLPPDSPDSVQSSLKDEADLLYKQARATLQTFGSGTAFLQELLHSIRFREK